MLEKTNSLFSEATVYTSLKGIYFMGLSLKLHTSVYSTRGHAKVCVPQHPIGDISKVVKRKAITVIYQRSLLSLIEHYEPSSQECERAAVVMALFVVNH